MKVLMERIKPEIDAAKPSNAFGWYFMLRRNCSEWFVTSNRSHAHPKPWPVRFNPQKDAVFSYNEIFIPNISAARIFDLLVSAKNWPSFYPNSDAVNLLGAEKLTENCEFRWKTFATAQLSKVELFEEDHALGWSADSPGTRAFHRWIIEPQNDGMRVITEECQNGITAWLDRALMNPALHASHQLWLERLKFVSQT